MAQEPDDGEGHAHLICSMASGMHPFLVTHNALLLVDGCDTGTFNIACPEDGRVSPQLMQAHALVTRCGS
eukprot:4682448-Amphidinium_carterae.1